MNELDAWVAVATEQHHVELVDGKAVVRLPLWDERMLELPIEQAVERFVQTATPADCERLAAALAGLVGYLRG